MTTKYAHIPLFQQTNQTINNNELKGLLMVVCSTFFFSLNSLCVKLSRNSFSISELIFVRSSIQVIFSLISLSFVKKKVPLDRESSLGLAGRALFGSIGLFLYYFTLYYLTLSDATILFFTMPLFAALLSSIFLNERLHLSDILFAILCFGGVYITTFNKVDDSKSSNYEAVPTQKNVLVYGMGLIGAFFTACAYICLKSIKKNISPMIPILYFGGTCAIVSGILLPNGVLFLSLNINSMFVLMGGIFTLIEHIFLNIGFKYCSTKTATLIRNLSIVFSVVYSIFISNENKNSMSFTGSAVVLLGVLLKSLMVLANQNGLFRTC